MPQSCWSCRRVKSHSSHGDTREMDLQLWAASEVIPVLSHIPREGFIVCRVRKAWSDTWHRKAKGEQRGRARELWRSRRRRRMMGWMWRWGVVWQGNRQGFEKGGQVNWQPFRDTFAVRHINLHLIEAEAQINLPQNADPSSTHRVWRRKRDRERRAGRKSTDKRRFKVEEVLVRSELL